MKTNYQEALQEAINAIQSVEDIEPNEYGDIDVRNGYPKGYWPSTNKFRQVGVRLEAIHVIENMGIDVRYTAFNGFNNYGKISYDIIRGGIKAMEAIDRLAEAIRDEKKMAKKAEKAEKTPAQKEERKAKKQEKKPQYQIKFYYKGVPQADGWGCDVVFDGYELPAGIEDPSAEEKARAEFMAMIKSCGEFSDTLVRVGERDYSYTRHYSI